MTTLYRKTPKGQAEIETRENRLTTRARQLLILVNGRREAADLRALAPALFGETLALLLDGGYVESVVETHPHGPPPADFEVRRRAIVRAVKKTLGASAATIALRMEAAETPEELSPLIDDAADALARLREDADADDFADGLFATLR
ncbi:MAG: hypothetical protein JNM33_09220 [Rubrivivax sp.]|nr:hypothetical protein [Rubrivivax sp.]